MLHGPNKRRQMARSILPSRARKQARERLDAIHRRHRRAVRQTLVADWRVRNVAADELFDLGDDTRWPQPAISEVVSDRRFADTLNHFERWAVATTRGLPRAERLPSLVASLPPGVIGAHAESHLRRLREIAPPADHDRDPFRRRPTARDDREHLRAALHRAIETGRHAELNRQLRYAGSTRLLLGAHDVDDFLTAVSACQRPHWGRWCGGWCRCGHTVLGAIRRFAAREVL